MILKNKTIHTQTISLKDGTVLAARPGRTLVLGEAVDYDSSVWEVEGQTEPKKSVKGN